MTLFPYTRANHFQFGYKSSSTFTTRWLDRRRTQQETFVAKYGRAALLQASWPEANTSAATAILTLAQNRALIPVICCSGGLDSEITLYSFFEAWSRFPAGARPSFEIATMDFIDGAGASLNRHDTEYVAKFLKRFQPKDFDLKWRRFSLDIEKFCENDEFTALADEAQVISPAVVTQLWLCQKIFGENPQALPVIGQGEMHLVRDVSAENSYAPATWQIVETENLCGLYRFFLGRGLPAVPGFFQYTPEQFETQLRTNPILHQLISNSRYGKLGTRSSKAEILAFDYPELEARPKYTGFEKIEALYEGKRASLLRRPLATEAKWHRSIYDLMSDLRPVACDDGDDPAPIKPGDWKFAWGRGGARFSSRTSPDDIFATEWQDSAFFREALQGRKDRPSAVRHFVSNLQSYLESHSQRSEILLLHDGGLVARIFACLLARNDFAGKFRILRPDEIPLPSATDLVPVLFALGSSEPELIARSLFAIYASSLSTVKADVRNAVARNTVTQMLIPLLHGRIVNAEYDRELQATLARPRYVWLENELHAVLAAQLRNLKLNALRPWTDEKIARATLEATSSTGWFAADEPGPSNRIVFHAFLEQALEFLEEAENDRKIATDCAVAFTALQQNVAESCRQLACRYPKFQMSAHAVTPSDLSPENADTQAPRSPDIAAAFSASAIRVAGLKTVSEDVWLENARVKVPELRLGSNLFFQQQISGFKLLDKNIRAYVALVDADELEQAWAQVTLLNSAPNGKLRIRGVTTRPGSERRGHANALLKKISAHLRDIASTHLKGITSVDVYAAPEVVKPFRAAGFTDDDTRMTRAEEGVDIQTGNLVALDRELTPLTLRLGDT